MPNEPIDAPHGNSPRLARAVHVTLLTGVAVSALLLIAGLARGFAAPPQGAIVSPPAFSAILRGALSGDGAAILVLGLLTLMVTPILRVAVLAASWAATRDRIFAAVALAVLALLIVSLILGTG